MDAPAWTFRGQSIPYLKHCLPELDQIQAEGPVALRPMMERALRHRRRLTRPRLPSGTITHPILMVSGEADAMWPSVRLAEIAERRAAQHGVGSRITNLRYPDAGHLCGGVPGLPVPGEVPLSQGFFSLGGTPAGNARARADSWPQVLRFLARWLVRENPGARAVKHRSPDKGDSSVPRLVDRASVWPDFATHADLIRWPGDAGPATQRHQFASRSAITAVDTLIDAD